MDPLAQAMQRLNLGWLYQAARRRFYCDELYQATIVRFVIWLSRMCYHFDKRWVVDPLINLVGRVTRLAADVSATFDRVVIDGLVNLSGRAGVALSTLSRWTDDVIVDGVVNGLGRATGDLGRALRPIQTGKVQNYLLVAMMTVLALVSLYIFYR